MVAKSKVKKKPKKQIRQKQSQKQSQNVNQIVRIYLDERKKARKTKPRASKQITRGSIPNINIAPVFKNPINDMYPLQQPYNPHFYPRNPIQQPQAVSTRQPQAVSTRQPQAVSTRQPQAVVRENVIPNSAPPTATSSTTASQYTPPSSPTNSIISSLTDPTYQTLIPPSINVPTNPLVAPSQPVNNFPNLQDNSSPRSNSAPSIETVNTRNNSNPYGLPINTRDNSSPRSNSAPSIETVNTRDKSSIISGSDISRLGFSSEEGEEEEEDFATFLERQKQSNRPTTTTIGVNTIKRAELLPAPDVAPVTISYRKMQTGAYTTPAKMTRDQYRQSLIAEYIELRRESNTKGRPPLNEIPNLEKAIKNIKMKQSSNNRPDIGAGGGGNLTPLPNRTLTRGSYGTPPFLAGGSIPAPPGLSVSPRQRKKDPRRADGK